MEFHGKYWTAATKKAGGRGSWNQSFPEELQHKKLKQGFI